MADAVTTQVLWNQAQSDKYIARFMNVSDGTGETNVAKIDISGLAKPDGTAPTKVSIERVQFAISPTMLVKISTDHTSDDTIAVLTGTDDISFDVPIIDPASAGGTGDVLFSTVGAGANDTYDITLYLRLY